MEKYSLQKELTEFARTHEKEDRDLADVDSRQSMRIMFASVSRASRPAFDNAFAIMS